MLRSSRFATLLWLAACAPSPDHGPVASHEKGLASTEPVPAQPDAGRATPPEAAAPLAGAMQRPAAETAPDSDAGPPGPARLPAGGIDRRNVEGKVLACARPAAPAASPAVRMTAQLDDLVGPEIQLNGHMGLSLALDGDTIAAGTLRTEQLEPRAQVTVLSGSGSSWLQQALLTPPDEDARTSFGEQLALLGDTLVVAAPNDDGRVVAGAPPGRVYAYARDGAGRWQLQAALSAEHPLERDGFGTSLALAPDLLAVGVVSTAGGTVELFERTSTGFQRLQTLSPIEPLTGYGFGASLAIDGDTLAVGVMSGVNDTRQAIHVFVRAADRRFAPQAIVQPDQPTGLFGVNVSLHANTLVAGDPYHQPSDFDVERGAVYVFERDCSGRFQQRAMLTPGPEVGAVSFGRISLIDGDRLVIADSQDSTHAFGIDGPIQASSDDAAYGGAVYVFERGEQGYTQQSFIKTPPPSVREAYFGWGLAVSRGRILGGSRAGARLYLFE